MVPLWIGCFLIHQSGGFISGSISPFYLFISGRNWSVCDMMAAGALGWVDLGIPDHV